MLTYLTVGLSVLAAVLLVAACMNQRKLWWSTRAWRYQDPDAFEPTKTALIVGRVAKLVAAAVLVGGAVLVDGPVRDSTAYDQRDVWSVAVQASADLDGRPLVNVNEFDLQDQVRKALADAAGDQAKAEEKKKSGLLAHGLPFEITNADGDHPVCMTVYADRLPESTAARALVSVSTSIDEGRC
ncbi:hypothetical protein [Actinomadura sp. 7K507]|uniref:hypothetical protein n=1 Tax=Actinomadura sp. 7K507 TaxID=2530365 RepID=UPI00104A893F|nr:hypothetical protein [Actinomadura sp. 7K507]TDC77228.1 hypothetical protein E1285_38955 [Actinomadura sp. 7K507]